MASRADTLLTAAEEKDEVLDSVSASVFTDNLSSHIAQVSRPQDRN